MLSDLNAKLAEKDTLVAQLWDDVAQIDQDAQDACKTYDEQIGRIVRDLEEVRKKSISAIDRIISGDLVADRSCRYVSTLTSKSSDPSKASSTQLMSTISKLEPLVLSRSRE